MAIHSTGAQQPPRTSNHQATSQPKSTASTEAASDASTSQEPEAATSSTPNREQAQQQATHFANASQLTGQDASSGSVLPGGSGEPAASPASSKASGAATARVRAEALLDPNGTEGALSSSPFKNKGDRK